MLGAVLSLTLAGLLFGALLALAARLFAVNVDPRVERVKEALPGANCGACGYPGCAGLADAIVKGEAPVDACPVGGSKTTAAVAAIMGVESCELKSPRVARLLCAGGENCVDRGEYGGLPDCAAAALLGGGHKACEYGCLGFGNCERACPFDAITMGESGFPIIDEELCTACGKCVAACPKRLIELVPKHQREWVRCVNHYKGAVVRKICRTGCITCESCVKNCPSGAMHCVDNVCHIDYDKCQDCGTCAAKCPVKCIMPGKKVS